MPPLSAKESQRFCDEARDLYRRWSDEFDQVLRIEVVVDRRRKRGSVGKWEEASGAGLIVMMEEHCTPLVLCHEMAHVLCNARYGRNGHGPAFARIYLELVCSTLGGVSSSHLMQAFDTFGVDHDFYI